MALPIYTGGASTRRGKLMTELDAPLSEVLKATAEETWLRSPGPSIVRFGNQRRLETEITKNDEGNELDDDQIASILDDELEDEAPDEINNPLLSADAARAKVEDVGLELKIPDAGISERALNSLIELKQDELKRQLIFERSPRGFGTTTMKFATSIGVSLLDPVNIAASFIPVVGQARYSAMLARANTTAGRIAARSKVGAIEGVVGQTLVEPIVYGVAQTEQADYGLLDSMMNISLGTVFGAGLHVGAGAVGDALSKGRPWQSATPQGTMPNRVATWTPKDRAASMRIALAQSTTGRHVDLEPVISARDAAASIVPQTYAEAQSQAVSRLRTELENDLTLKIDAGITAKERVSLETEKVRIAETLDNPEAAVQKLAKSIQRRQKTSRKRAETRAAKQHEGDIPVQQARLRAIDDLLQQDNLAKTSKGDLAKLRRGEIPEQFAGRIDSDATATLRSARRRPMDEAVEGAREVERAWESVQRQSVRETQSHSTMADPMAADSVTTQLNEVDNTITLDRAQNELTDELAELNEMTDALGIENAEAAFKEFDDNIAKAKSDAKALRALALCQSRKS